MSCGVGRRCSTDPVLLWLWCRPSATAPIRPPAWEPPYAAGEALKSKKKKKKKSPQSEEYTRETCPEFYRKSLSHKEHRTLSSLSNLCFLSEKSTLGFVYPVGCLKPFFLSEVVQAGHVAPLTGISFSWEETARRQFSAPFRSSAPQGCPDFIKTWIPCVIFRF